MLVLTNSDDYLAILSVTHLDLRQAVVLRFDDGHHCRVTFCKAETVIGSGPSELAVALELEAGARARRDEPNGHDRANQRESTPALAPVKALATSARTYPSASQLATAPSFAPRARFTALAT